MIGIDRASNFKHIYIYIIGIEIMKLGSKESFFRPGSLKFFAFDGDLYCTLISHFAMIHRWAILFDDLPQTKWRFSIGSTISGN